MTDGECYRFFLTGKSQGDCVELQSQPPLPSEDSLPTRMDFVQFPPELAPLVDSFFHALKNDPEFLDDTIWHSECLEYWNKIVFANVSGVTRRELRKGITDWMMVRRAANRNSLLETVDNDFARIRNVLRFIADFHRDSIQDLNLLLDPRSALHIRGAGLFVITQLLASAHPGKYLILQDNIALALKDMHMTDVVVKTDVANGYIYANEVCKRIYKQKLHEKIKKGTFGLAKGFELAAVTNFLWHYYVHYKKSQRWT